MPEIRPTSDLKNRLPEIAEICREGQPVYITKNGRGDLVIMSQEHYERQLATLEVYRKLVEAEFAKASGARTYTLDEVSQEMQRIIDERKTRT
ncbi:MAG: type II toxin-antitoxin system prevent-host-death family antitoxin [Bacillota bacterium]|nr:type II toxin-antitoxin system prevent-host-death family antitoxin [Bacillota bacterium]